MQLYRTLHILIFRSCTYLDSLVNLVFGPKSVFRNNVWLRPGSDFKMRPFSTLHATVDRCNSCEALVANLQSSSPVEIALRDISLRTFCSEWFTFWSATECRHIFPQYICEWTICAV